MADEVNQASESYLRQRDLEGRLFQDVTSKIDQVLRAVEQLAADSKTQGERLARIEAMQIGYAQAVQDLKDDLKEAEDDLKEACDKIAALENRVTRLETLIVPGASILAALVSAAVGHFLH